MKPSNTVERTTALFQSSTVTYNEATVTYNDSSVHYGGSDRKVNLGPQNYQSSFVKPQNMKVE